MAALTTIHSWLLPLIGFLSALFGSLFTGIGTSRGWFR